MDILTTIPEVNVINWLLAFSPIVALLVLMVGFSWSGARAGAVGWIVAFVVAVGWFGAGADLLAYGQVKATLLSIWVLYIIWTALFLFHIVDLSGSVTTIGRGIMRVTGNQVMQVLLMAWIFTTFLQGIAGYGVPVAVVAPLMVAMGFSPVTSVVATSVGHSWSVTFGSLGASFFALAGVTGSRTSSLAHEAALLLGIACLLSGVGAVWSFGGPRAVTQSSVPLLFVGVAMAGTQYALAMAGAYSLAAFGAGVVGLLAMTALCQLPRYRAAIYPRAALPPVQGGSKDGAATVPQESPPSLKAVTTAFAPYAVLIVVVLAASLISALGSFLDAVQLDLPFPETRTSFGWTNDATDTFRSIEPFGHAGALLLYAAFVGYGLYRSVGLLHRGDLRRAASKTVASALASSLGIVTMVGMALTMMESGMTYLLAQGIASVSGPAFPLLSPFIGVLGCFMTGSNTNSNILFGALQRDSAQALGLPVAVILAAQTAGGALGSMLAPAKIIVGCSTVGLSGNEAPVIRQSVRYGIVITTIIGIITLIWSRLP